MSERRRGQRRKGDFKIGISKASVPIITDVKNISSSGVYCQVKYQIPYMEKVQVDLELKFKHKKKEKISCEGVIVRCDKVLGVDIECYDAAIFFSEISDHNRVLIEEYVKEHEK